MTQERRDVSPYLWDLQWAGYYYRSRSPKSWFLDVHVYLTRNMLQRVIRPRAVSATLGLWLSDLAGPYEIAANRYTRSVWRRLMITRVCYNQNINWKNLQENLLCPWQDICIYRARFSWGTEREIKLKNRIENI